MLAVGGQKYCRYGSFWHLGSFQGFDSSFSMFFVFLLVTEAHLWYSYWAILMLRQAPLNSSQTTIFSPQLVGVSKYSSNIPQIFLKYLRISFISYHSWRSFQVANHMIFCPGLSGRSETTAQSGIIDVGLAGGVENMSMCLAHKGGIQGTYWHMGWWQQGRSRGIPRYQWFFFHEL